MTENTQSPEQPQQDPLENFVLKFEFPVNVVNALLHILGNAPYVQSAALIASIQAQGEPQFKAAVEAADNKEA